MKKLILLVTIITSVSFATRIGVLKGDKNMKCNEEILIDLDTEDSNGDTRVLKGNPNPPGITLGGHARFTYCVVDSKEMSNVSFDFAVLSLDHNCPSGTTRVGRHHDTEDSHNANSHKGNIYPNIVDNNATLFYCFVPKVSKPKQKFPFKNKNYGIFANPTDTTNMSHSEIKIDDQDSHKYLSNFTIKLNFTTDKTTKDNPNPENSTSGYGFFKVKTRSNVNEWYYGGAPDDIVKRINKIMTGTKNTNYHTVKWTGKSSAILSKVAEEDLYNTPSITENQVTTAARIKNISRAGINIDLKSAGNVEILITNINGSTVTKISKEYMLPGIHSINWNSTNIPNGSYIATIKQNGMISSNKVILK